MVKLRTTYVVKVLKELCHFVGCHMAHSGHSDCSEHFDLVKCAIAIDVHIQKQLQEEMNAKRNERRKVNNPF